MHKLRYADNHTRKLTALIEVVLVFALLHVTYRALKNFTALGHIEGSVGLNLTPGLAMIAFTFVAIGLHRRALRDYGLTLADWPRHISLAVIHGLGDIIGVVPR